MSMRAATLTINALAAAVLLAACAGREAFGDTEGLGADPTLPAPRQSLIPTVDIAPASGWKAGEAPTPARGLRVTRFADGLRHPRWLHVLPNGDVLVAVEEEGFRHRCSFHRGARKAAAERWCTPARRARQP